MVGTKLNGKVNASTIMEVIVAMVVIVVVFGIAMMIFNNVLRLSLSVKKLRAQALLQQVVLTAEQTKGNSSQTLSLDGFTIIEEIKPFQQTSLVVISLTAYDDNKEKISSLQKIIRND